jgi:hypothetical protein
MNGREALSERLLAIFLLGALLLNAPFLSIFDKPTMVFGFPTLYAYVFIVWVALIVSIALTTFLLSENIANDGDRDHDNGRSGRGNATASSTDKMREWARSDSDSRAEGG